MRKVLRSNDEVMHFWANQTQSEGRASSVSFSGRMLKSYAAIIGNITDKVYNGKNVVLLSSRRYSVTTGCHISMAARASNQHFHLYVPRPENNTKRDMILNMDALNAAVLDCFSRFSRSLTGIQYRMQALDELRESAYIFNQIFFQGKNKVFDFGRKLATVPDEYGNRYVDCRKAFPVFPVPFPDNFNAIWDKVQARNARAELRNEIKYAAENELREKRMAELRMEYQEKIGRWINGENVRLPWIGNNDVSLRFNPENDTVETTLNANVPVSHAEKLFRIIISCKYAGKEFISNGHAIHIGHYTVSKISADGTLTAGCHVIPWNEISRFASVMGWENQPEDTVQDTVTV